MRTRRTNRNQAAVDLTPMLDVVFILLIFFIVTSTFIQEKAIGTGPPPPAGSSGQEELALTIYIDDQDRIQLNRHVIPLAELPANLARLRAESPDAPVVIIAAPQARSGVLIKVRDKVYSADIPRVSITRSAA